MGRDGEGQVCPDRKGCGHAKVLSLKSLISSVDLNKMLLPFIGDKVTNGWGFLSE